MSSDHKARFGRALWALAEACGAELTDSKIEVYCKLLLAEYSIEQLENTCLAFTREAGRKFFPTVPEFHEKLLGSYESNAAQAFWALEQVMRTRGAYRSVAFSDPALTNAVELAGGWVQVCRDCRELDLEAYGYWRHRFIKGYIESAKGAFPPARKYFQGLLEAGNEATLGAWSRGLLPPPTVCLVAITGKVVEVPLEKIEPRATLVEAYQKQLVAAQAEQVGALTDGHETVEPESPDAGNELPSL